MGNEWITNEEHEEMRLTLLQQIEHLNKINFSLKSEISKITQELINLKLEKVEQSERDSAIKVYRF